MDMEHLSKSQIVLLTLLVSFFTSIATGIVTVSLMDQAPPIVAQTVNRVIEKTVETVAAAPTPQKNQSQAAATLVTQEKTVIVNESELISKAIEKFEPSVVRIYTSADEPGFLGLGFVLDARGTIVTDIGAIDDRAEVLVATMDGARVRMFVVDRDSARGIAYVRASTTTEAQAQKPIAWKPVSIATNRPVLGATVVALSGKTVSRIASGLVTAVLTSESGAVIDTNITENSIMNGSPLIDSSGNLVGVSTSVSRTSSDQGFIAGNELLPTASKKSPQ